jgi:hypothetical protein
LWIQCAPEDPLADEQWKLAKQEARNFEIPVELVAGTLAAEIVYDTDWYDYWVDVYTVKVPLYTLYCSDSSAPDKQTAKRFLDWYYYTEFAGPELGPGPGIAQIHVKTAEEAENWFNNVYPGQGYLDKPPDIYQRLATLVTDAGSIRYAAAILRELADIRTAHYQPHFYEEAPKYNPASLTDLDMQVIYEAYQAGIKIPYRDSKGFQQTADPKTYGPRILPYLAFYRYKP